MSNHSSATPHKIKSTNNTFTDALKRRAESLINDNSIDAETRALIRYGMEIDDPWLAELVRRADAGENIVDNLTACQPKKRLKHWQRYSVGPAMNLLPHSSF